MLYTCLVLFRESLLLCPCGKLLCLVPLILLGFDKLFKVFNKVFHSLLKTFVCKRCQMSKFSANLAFFSMNSFLGSTLSPIRSENISSQSMASSTVTFRSVRRSGSMVVSQS